MFSFRNVATYMNRVRYMQYLTTVLATLSATSCAMYAHWPSPALPKLTSVDSPIGFAIGVEEVSWIVSCLPLGVVCMACFKIFFGELCGPKAWLLTAGICLVVPGIVLYFGECVSLIYAARFMIGMATAMVFTTLPVYIAEIAEKDIRGRLALSIAILSVCGGVFVMTFGPYISYRNLTLSCAVVPLVFLVLFYFMPESPYYLVKRERREAALKSLVVLSRNNEDSSLVNKRLKNIEDTVSYDMKNATNVWEFLHKKEYRTALVIMLGTKGLLQMSGINVIDAYAQTIIEDANSSISPEFSSLLFGVIQIPAAIIASFLVDKVGRKPLWIISAFGCAASLFGVGLFFYLDETDAIGWLPTACLLVYFTMGPIGVTTLPFVLAGEIFPTNIKGAAVSFSVFYSSVLTFAVLKVLLPLATQFGMHIIFWMFAGCCLSGIFFIVFVVPETKGKSLEEIQSMVNKNRTSGIDP